MTTLLDQVYGYIGVDPTALCSEDIGAIRLAVNSSLLQIRAYTGRYLTEATWVDSFKLFSRAKVILAEYPVTSITSVFVGGVELATDEYRVNARDGLLYRICNSTSFEWWIWDGIRGQDLFPTVEVTYTAGYPNLPDDLVMLISDFASQRLRQFRAQQSYDFLGGPVNRVDIDGLGKVFLGSGGVGILSGERASVAAGGPIFGAGMVVVDSYRDYHKFIKPERHFLLNEVVVSPPPPPPPPPPPSGP